MNRHIEKLHRRKLVSDKKQALKNGIQGKGFNIRLYWTDFAWVAAILAISTVCLELFYRMIVNYNDKYESDVRYYVSTRIQKGEKHDRILTVIFEKLYHINDNTMEANIYMAAVIAAIIVVNFIIIRFFIKHDGMLDSVPRYSMQVASLAALFTGPIYFPVLHEWYYMHSFESFAWHSPTQQSMVLFSMIATLCFLKMFLGYEEGISVGWWIATMITCILSASTKPSFIVGFILTVIIFFLIELFKGGKEDIGKRFTRLFIMGLSLVPAGVYTLWLQTKEFGDTTINEGEHHIVYGLKVLLSHEDVLREMIFGMAFALVVMAANYKRFKVNKYFLTLLIFLTGVFQWAFFTETGKRANYGNFDWGRMHGNYFLSLICLALLIENIFVEDSVFPNNKKARKIYIAIALIILAMSVLSQLNYFRLILTGHGYMR